MHSLYIIYDKSYDIIYIIYGIYSIYIIFGKYSIYVYSFVYYRGTALCYLSIITIELKYNSVSSPTSTDIIPPYYWYKYEYKALIASTNT